MITLFLTLYASPRQPTARECHRTVCEVARTYGLPAPSFFDCWLATIRELKDGARTVITDPTTDFRNEDSSIHPVRVADQVSAEECVRTRRGALRQLRADCRARIASQMVGILPPQLSPEAGQRTTEDGRPAGAGRTCREDQ